MVNEMSNSQPVQFTAENAKLAEIFFMISFRTLCSLR
jgi:hypothetical protein